MYEFKTNYISSNTFLFLIVLTAATIILFILFKPDESDYRGVGRALATMALILLLIIMILPNYILLFVRVHDVLELRRKFVFSSLIRGGDTSEAINYINSKDQPKSLNQI